MDTLNSLAVVSLAALIHASFQLSISTLTLLSGHAIGSKKSHSRVLKLTTSFVAGAGIMIFLLLSTIVMILTSMYGSNTPQVVWAIACGLLFGVGLSVWIFYYRREKGTTLWIPRSIADYLKSRIKVTKSSGEAFGLGLSSTIGEILFIVAPMFIAALVLTQISPVWQIVGVAIYMIVSMFPLFVVWGLVGSGHSLSSIQKWRESNKYFMRFAAGAGLLTLSFFVYVFEIIGNAAGLN